MPGSRSGQACVPIQMDSFRVLPASRLESAGWSNQRQQDEMKVMTANEVDVHVGQRTRHLRETLGISQGTLGRHLGLTFSQVQKYEKGTNRIGAGPALHDR